MDPTYSTGTWGGVTGIANTAGNAISTIQSKQDLFGQIANKEIGSSAYSASLASLDNLASKYDESATSYYVSNPLNGSSDCIIDLRIGWKSYDQDSSQEHVLYLQRSIYQTVVYPSMEQLKGIAEDVVHSSALSDASSGISEITKFKDDIASYKEMLIDYMDIGSKYISYVELGNKLYLAIIIGCAGLMLIGSSGLICCEWNRCRIISHVGWIVFYLLMLVGLLLSAVLFPVSVVLSEACDVLSLQSLRDGVFTPNSSAWDQIKVCIDDGGGDLYTKYGLQDKIGFAQKTLNSLDVIEGIYKDDSLVYNLTDPYISRVSCLCY